MKNEVLNRLLKLIERKYGALNNDSGCYVNGRWLSVEAIVTLIDKVDRER